jgi:D-tyrosyl-tRNA(Tyr) deacylase
MKIVIQRCSAARVEVDAQVVGEVARGLVAFVGVEEGDDENCAAKLARKIAALRVFDNSEGRFDLAVRDVNGAVLAISNFTLCGETRKGTRPNWGSAAKPEAARRLFDCFVTLLSDQGVPVQTGVFGAAMRVYVDNDGPVTMILTANADAVEQ